MAEKRILKFAIWIVSAPLIIASRLTELFSGSCFSSDLRLCLKIIDKFDGHIPRALVNALVIAEDHRNPLHFGVDPIAIVRALLVRLCTGRLQGASTIEQQFARVVTGRYEWTFSRKVREQMLAIALVRRKSKEAIATAYLSIAFYGSNSIGLDGLKARFGPRLDAVDHVQALAFMARLKYPRPRFPHPAWRRKIGARTELLMNRKHGIDSVSLRGSAYPQPTMDMHDC